MEDKIIHLLLRIDRLREIIDVQLLVRHKEKILHRIKQFIAYLMDRNLEFSEEDELAINCADVALKYYRFAFDFIHKSPYDFASLAISCALLLESPDNNFDNCTYLYLCCLFLLCAESCDEYEAVGLDPNHPFYFMVNLNQFPINQEIYNAYRLDHNMEEDFEEIQEPDPIPVFASSST